VRTAGARPARRAGAGIRQRGFDLVGVLPSFTSAAILLRRSVVAVSFR
jgi:hypothetical protein